MITRTHEREPSLGCETHDREFCSGIDIPLHPFFGSMGVAPPDVTGRISSIHHGFTRETWTIRSLVAGSTLFIPIHARGALFEVGEWHAGQGDGEVDVTALETSLIGTFQFIVRKDVHLLWPRAETPTHYITMDCMRTSPKRQKSPCAR